MRSASQSLTEGGLGGQWGYRLDSQRYEPPPFPAVSYSAGRTRAPRQASPATANPEAWWRGLSMRWPKRPGAPGITGRKAHPAITVEVTWRDALRLAAGRVVLVDVCRDARKDVGARRSQGSQREDIP